MKDVELFVHVGAPRTGTSFLRKNVFPRLEGIHFKNKETDPSALNKFFESIAHYGDGDELSEALPSAMPHLEAGKYLVSEEHFLWSVYHMMGNVRSRAGLLKKAVPDAKIILTIRRQPEYLNSIFSYFQNLDRSHLGRQMKSIEDMVNVAREFDSGSIFWLRNIPCGLGFYEKLKLIDINENYFNRDLRHFIAADFSWYRLYSIYADFFGRDKILVVPQEIWSVSPMEGVTELEKFFRENIQHDQINFNDKVNPSSTRCKGSLSGDEKKRFEDYIMSLVSESNNRLSTELEGIDLGKLGYCDKHSTEQRILHLGFATNQETVISKETLHLVNRAREIFLRVGLLRTLQLLRKTVLHRISQRGIIKKKLYKYWQLTLDRVRGTDFERIESVKKLRLRPDSSEQYEASKPFELEKVFRGLDLPKDCVAIDFGAGKGKIVWFLSKLPGIKKVIGVELSPDLVQIAQENLEKVKAKDYELINLDVCNLTDEIIGGATLFYFYNPFPRKIFEKVFWAIEDSLRKRRVKRAILVYFNPLCDDIITCSRLLKSRRVYANSISNAPTHVYELGV